MEQRRNEDIKQADNDDQSDILFDYNDMLMPDDIIYDDDHQIFPGMETDLGFSDRDDSIIVEEWDIITPTIDRGRPKKSNSTSAYQSSPPSSTTIKKTKTNSNGLVNKYVNQMFEEDITASLKSLEKKYKREQSDDGGLCEQCGLSFPNSTEYKKHIRSHDDKGMCVCVCDL